jgi:16S rRNA (adenine1518-N6/adenine1519-N6)-dimethyltransferase
VLLVQEEVADRLVAAPGSKRYGALTVGVRVVAEVEKLFRILPGAFVPPPRVTSAVVRLRLRAAPLLDWAEVPGFRAFVTACFARRRKQLMNVVRGVTGWPRDAAGAALAELGLDGRLRPEVVTPGGFARLYRRCAREGAVLAPEGRL